MAEGMKDSVTFHPLSSLGKTTRIWILAVMLVFLALRLWGDSRLGYWVLNSDQINYMVFSLKAFHPALFPRDPVFADAGHIAHYTPLFLNFLQGFFERMSYIDTFRTLQVLLGLGFMAGFFTLLYGVSGCPWISLLVTLLGSEKIQVFPIETWGADSVHLVLARTFYLVAVPWFYMGWIRFQHAPQKLYLLYFSIGLLGNLHPVSYITFVAPLLLAQLYQKRFDPAAWTQAMVCGVVSLVPMLPFAVQYFTHTQEGIPLDAVSYQLALTGIGSILPFVDPHRLWDGPITVWQAIGWYIVGSWALWQTREREQWGLIPLVLSCLIVFIGYYLFLLGVILPAHKLPVLIDIPRVLKFVLLPMLIATTLWLSTLHGKKLVAVSAGVVILTTVFNGELLKQYFQTHPVTPETLTKSMLVQGEYFLLSRGLLINDKLQAKIDSYTALADAGNWLKTHTDPATTLIHPSLPDSDWIPNNLLRATSERSITFSLKDGGILYQSDKPAFIRWFQMKEVLAQWQGSLGYCSEPEIQFAQTQLSATHLACFNTTPPVPMPVAYQNPYVTVYRLNVP